MNYEYVKLKNALRDGLNDRDLDLVISTFINPERNAVIFRCKGDFEEVWRQLQMCTIMGADNVKPMIELLEKLNHPDLKDIMKILSEYQENLKPKPSPQKPQPIFEEESFPPKENERVTPRSQTNRNNEEPMISSTRPEKRRRPPMSRRDLWKRLTGMIGEDQLSALAGELIPIDHTAKQAQVSQNADTLWRFLIDEKLILEKSAQPLFDKLEDGHRPSTLNNVMSLIHEFHDSHSDAN